MKKFTRILAIVLALATIFSFAACSSKDGGEKKMKVGFIFLHDENSTYDKNFITAAEEACKELGVEMVKKTGIGETQACYDAAADLADQGCSIVFADSFGHESFMIQAAEKYPDVQFCHATGTQAHTKGLKNFHNAFASIYEGRYLAGIAAGMKLNAMIKEGKFEAKDAKIGYVGAFPYAEVKSGYTSFFLGVRSVCKEATMEVQFTGSWYDEAKEKEAATLLIGRGCKLISQHADSMGAPTACENAGIPNVSYNGSTLDACPNTFIVSSRINWVPYMKYMIECVRDGKEIDTDWCKGINEGAVELTAINDKVAAPALPRLSRLPTSSSRPALFMFLTPPLSLLAARFSPATSLTSTPTRTTPPTPRLFPTVTSTSLRSVLLLTSILTSTASLFSTNN